MASVRWFMVRLKYQYIICDRSFDVGLMIEVYFVRANGAKRVNNVRLSLNFARIVWIERSDRRFVQS